LVAARRLDRGAKISSREVTRSATASSIARRAWCVVEHATHPASRLTFNCGWLACRRRGRLRGALRSGWGGHGRSARCPRHCRRTPWS